jgi:hypothetical protein
VLFIVLLRFVDHPWKGIEEAGRRRPRAAQAWIARLEHLSAQDIEVIFANIPSDRISAVAKDFAIRMLALNSQRLLTR